MNQTIKLQYINNQNDVIEFYKKRILKNLSIAMLVTWVLTAVFFWLWWTNKNAIFAGLMAYGICISIKSTFKFFKCLMTVIRSTKNISVSIETPVTFEVGPTEFSIEQNSTIRKYLFSQIKRIEKFNQSLIISLKKNAKSDGSIIIASNAFKEFDQEKVLAFFKEQMLKLTA